MMLLVLPPRHSKCYFSESPKHITTTT
jgi:hypothetical protein